MEPQSTDACVTPQDPSLSNNTDVNTKSKRKIVKEDGGAMVGGAPVNAAEGGAIDGIGVGLRGEPGVHPKKRKLSPFISYIRRKPPNV